MAKRTELDGFVRYDPIVYMRNLQGGEEAKMVQSKRRYQRRWMRYSAINSIIFDWHIIVTTRKTLIMALEVTSKWILVQIILVPRNVPTMPMTTVEYSGTTAAISIESTRHFM